jgi:hypothetical protein
MSQSTVMSLFIPCVFGDITKEFMIKTIEFQGLGKVKHIDFVEKMGKNGNRYNSAFVHFEYWYDNIASVNFQERVKNPEKEARIVYREPWFWACFENKGKKHIPGERKERINLTELSNNENRDNCNNHDNHDNDLSRVFEFEEEKNDFQLPQEIEDKFERELLAEFGCDHDNDKNDCDLILYQKKEQLPRISNINMNMNMKKEINMEYVRHLEMLNYKLIHDLYELRGDFILT